MQTKRLSITSLASVCVVLVIASLLLVLMDCNGTSQSTDTTMTNVGPKLLKPDVIVNPVVALTDIKLSFKMESRLIGGTYGAPPWVSPKTYVGASAQDTVETNAQGLDAKGRPVRINPDWVPADPDMVSVEPNQGDMVKIIVKRSGQSKLTVAAQGFSKDLLIKSKAMGKFIQLEISQ